MSNPVDQAVAAWHLRHRDRARDQASVPEPAKAMGADRMPEVRHIVLLMMENHSFDNYFGMLGHGEGLAQGGAPNKTKDGVVVPPYHLSSTAQQPGVPTQSWHASHIQYGSGGNDGFVRSIEETVPGRDPQVPMGYWDQADLPFYSGLARTFALADRWHCSLLGPTFPNRRFLVAGTANGLIDDLETGLIDYPRTGTIFDLLDRHGIPWANYHHVGAWKALGQRAVLGNVGLRTGRTARLALGALRGRAMNTGTDDLQFTADMYPLGFWRFLFHLRHIDQFFAAARDGQLPAVSIVDPDFQHSSEENPQDISVGEAFAAEVINAVMQGKGWPHTLLIWFYDEHGGYYDHVPPPEAVEPDDVLPRSLLEAGAPVRWILAQLGLWPKLRAADSGAGRYDRYGFRVPAVVVSPYAKPGYVSSTVYDHTSVLRLIEHKWNLPPLTARDANAVTPLDMLDFATPAFMTPPPLPPPAALRGTRQQSA